MQLATCHLVLLWWYATMATSFTCLNFGQPIKLTQRSVLAASMSATNGDGNISADECLKDKDHAETPVVQIVIRNAQPADMGEISHIVTKGFIVNKTNFITYHIERLNTYLSLESTFPSTSQLQKVHKMLVACRPDNSKVIGFCEVDMKPTTLHPASMEMAAATTTLMRGERNMVSHHSAPRPYMYNLVVDKFYRRMGIATALIQKCEDIVVNTLSNNHEVVDNRNDIIKPLFLRVRQGNEAALKLYEGMGYEEQLGDHVDDERGQMILLLKKNFCSRNIDGENDTLLGARVIYMPRAEAERQ